MIVFVQCPRDQIYMLDLISDFPDDELSTLFEQSIAIGYCDVYVLCGV